MVVADWGVAEGWGAVKSTSQGGLGEEFSTIMVANQQCKFKKHLAFHLNSSSSPFLSLVFYGSEFETIGPTRTCEPKARIRTEYLFTLKISTDKHRFRSSRAPLWWNSAQQAIK